MPLALGSLDRVVPGRESQKAESLGSAENVESAENIEGHAETEKDDGAQGAGLFESTGKAVEPGEGADPVEPALPRDEAQRAEEARPEFERVTEVLGPLEQIVLAADQEIGSLQERVDAESGEVTSRIQSKVREAALEQRGRVVEMRAELTDAATQLATRFETMLDILDQAERQLASQAGESPEAGMRVTLTEKRRVTFSHEQTESGPPPSTAPPVLEAPAESEAPKKQKRIRGWFRRRKGSEA
jgi:hypothetical protein